MPIVHRYVNPDADVGGDGTTSATSSGGGTHAYQSLATWNASTTVGSSTDHYVYCERGSTTPRDTSQCTVNLTVGNNSFVYILPNDTSYDPDTGADATSYHYGVYDAGYVIYTQTNSVNTLHITSSKVSVSGIEVRSEPASVKSGRTIYVAQTIAYTHKDLIARGGGTYGVLQVIQLHRGILHNVISDGYGVSTTAFEQSNFASGACYNCLAVNCSEGYQAQATGGVDPILVNCCAYGNTTDYIDDGGGWNASCATCATSDASAAESWVTVTSVASGDFTNATSKDWSLASGSALAEQGTTSGAPTTDIALEARS